MGIFIDSKEFDPSLRRRIAAFINERFVEPDADAEIAYERASCGYADAPMMAAAPMPSSQKSFEHMAAPEPQNPRRSGFGGIFGKAREKAESVRMYEEASVCDAQAAEMPDDAPCRDNESLSSWLDQVDEPFSTTLLALIDRKGLEDVEVYKRAHMSRQLFSRIRSDALYRPAKKTVLALAIAMELSLTEMRDLLERAGFALSRSSKRDLIVEYFVANGIYDLFAINNALYEFDQPLI